LTWTTLLLFLATLYVFAQTASTAKDFVIDQNRPYVYLKFDHIGVGIQRNENEPISRIWLRLVNNCRVPIIVSTFGVPGGSPKGEAGVMDNVVPVVISGVTVGHGIQVESIPPPLAPVEPEQKVPAKNTMDEMPGGYMFEVGSSDTIPPGKDILFSIPANHLSKRWYVEIPFRFDLPKGKGPRDQNIGGEPQMVITYSMWDLPSKNRTDFEQK
jgi:hypothetical protein